MGLRRQEASLAYRIDETRGHGVGQTAKLQAGPRGQLQIAAAELLRDPAQPAKRRTARLPARNPNPDNGPILCQVGAQHSWAAVRASHARHRRRRGRARLP